MASGLGRGEVICVVAIALMAFPALTLAQTPAASIEAKVGQPVPTSDSPILNSLESVPSALRLREWHDLLGGEPHVAGTDGDAREIRRIDLAFRKMGLIVETHEFWPLLSRPISARVEIVDKTDDASFVGLRFRASRISIGSSSSSIITSSPSSNTLFNATLMLSALAPI